jgi:lipopolysaccharide heptosyltransferase I
MTRILVFRLSALGDVIHTIPAVVAIRDGIPDSDIAWVVERPYRDLVKIVANVETIPVSMKKWGRAFVSSRGEVFAARAAMRGFDIAVDFQGLIKSASLAWVARAPLRYGFDRDAIREGPAGLFVNRRVNVDRSKHVVEWNLALAKAVAPGIDKLPDVDFTPFAADATGKLRELHGRVVLVPGAGRPDKQWPASSFRELAERLGEQNVVVVWGPDEQQLAEEIGVGVAPPTDLRELAYLLQHARAVVAADTGPLHLAAALRTPVVALFGPTDARRNGPYGQLDRVVEAADKSMASIPVDDVMRKLAEVAP